MKTRIIKTEEAYDIIEQYWTEGRNTISLNAKEYLQEQIDLCSIEIELPKETEE